MKQTKNKIINLRVTEAEYDSIQDMTKVYKISASDLLRKYINTEYASFLKNNKTQGKLFKTSAEEKKLLMMQTLNTISSLMNLSEMETVSVTKGTKKDREMKT